MSAFHLFRHADSFQEFLGCLLSATDPKYRTWCVTICRSSSLGFLKSLGWNKHTQNLTNLLLKLFCVLMYLKHKKRGTMKSRHLKKKLLIYHCEFSVWWMPSITINWVRETHWPDQRHMDKFTWHYRQKYQKRNQNSDHLDTADVVRVLWQQILHQLCHWNLKTEDKSPERTFLLLLKKQKQHTSMHTHTHMHARTHQSHSPQIIIIQLYAQLLASSIHG